MDFGLCVRKKALARIFGALAVRKKFTASRRLF